jgi:hypothetical protein
MAILMLQMAPRRKLSPSVDTTGTRDTMNASIHKTTNAASPSSAPTPTIHRGVNQLLIQFPVAPSNTRFVMIFQVLSLYVSKLIPTRREAFWFNAGRQTNGIRWFPATSSSAFRE